MGGSERLVYNLAKKLDRELFNPSIAWFLGDRILKDFYELGIPLYHVPKIKRFDISTMRKLGKIIKDNNIHIINAHHFMSLAYSFYGCKIKHHRKLIYTEHSEWEIQKLPLSWTKIGSFLLKYTDCAVGVNSNIEKLIQRKFKTDHTKTITIYNGVDIEEIYSSDKKLTLRKELNISENDKIIGIVANFRKIKNHIFLLKTFKQLLKSYNHVRLLLIGQGFKGDTDNSEQEIRNFIKEEGLGINVSLLGYRSDIPDFLKIMDIFCLTSYKEGLPISLLEAMAAGLPVVGTDVEGIRDVIIPNKNGFLVQINDIEEMKNVLYTLLQDESLRYKFGKESIFMVKKKYALQHCVNRYQDLILSKIKNKKTL